MRGCKISIVYDSEGQRGFRTGWGFSALVEREGGRVLFDCGWDGVVLRHNLDRIGIRMADIDAVVLSHQHWDHVTGLTEVLSESRDDPVVVAVPPSFSRHLRHEISLRSRLWVVEGPTEIIPGVFSTGPVGSEIEEQALVLPFGKGSAVLTGCAHPGIRELLPRSSEYGEPKWLIGGIHDAPAADVPESLERLVLCHCTRNKTALLERFGTRASLGKVGDSFTPRPCPAPGDDE